MNASPAAANVTIIQPKSDNLHEAIDTLHTSQITGDYRYSALALAGPLMTEVGALFPLHMILIYLTTSYKRRQIWNAYIAATFADPDNSQPITNPDAVRAKLMNTSSKQLLQEAYGAIPEGFQNSLERLGLNGEEPCIYLLLHEQMSNSATLRKAYSHASKIEASTVKIIDTLPVPLQSYDLAKQFRKPEDVKNLIFMINTLGQGDASKYSDICSAVVQAAKRGHSVSAVLKRVYYQVKFPAAAVPDTEVCKHICNAFELKKTAKRFRNCLADYIPETLRREISYYRWYEAGRPVAVISIREDAPFGWRVDELLGVENSPLCNELELKIIKHFEEHGVYKMASMEGLLRELGYLGVLNDAPQTDPVDDINQVIDGLLNDDPI